jgi:GT2 family glycosyltransferase
VEAFDRRADLAAIGFRVTVGDFCEGGGAFNAFVAAGAAVRSSHFLSAGGFSEDFRYYVEEYALCYRFAELGLDVRMWDRPVVFHAKASTNREKGRILEQLVRNNRKLLQPHRNDDPWIAERLDELLTWYRLLARRYGATEEVEQAAMEEIVDSKRQVWTPEFWTRLAGLDRLDALASRLRDERVRRVAL